MSLDQVIMLPGLSSGPRLLLSDASESFDFEANSHSFFVNSNLTWSWSADVAWITSDEDTPQTGSQTFSYSVTENISTQRTGTITFTSGDITRTHTVTQGPYPILTIDDAAHTFDSDADSLTFNVTSNTDWTWFASEDWVTSSEAVFQNGNQAFTYSVTANTGAERTATITFVDVQAGVVTAVHSITQSAEATPLLLDTYTGAVGFSLRKIRTAYTGDCIRVRRASDDAEQDIGFSGNDLDTAAIETFCSGTTGYVTTWYDQVGSNDATQTTGSLQPIIYESSAVVVNEHGLPAIRFLDNDAVAGGPRFVIPTFYAEDAAYLAFASAYSLEVDGSNPPIIAGSPSERGMTSFHSAATREPIARTFRTGGQTTTSGASAIATSTTTIRFDYCDRTDIKVFLNTTATADSTASDRNEDFNTLNDITLGGRNFVTILNDTLISEFIAFTADQTSSNLSIRTDMVDYWTDPTPPAPLTLSIDSASATFNEDAQSGSFEVTSNTDWTWTSSAAWLTSAETSPQNGNQTFSYSVSENTGSERVATITLSITGTNVIHTVTQDAAPVPPVDPDIEDFTEFDYVADMVASMDAAKGAGQVWYAQGYRYVELDSGATDQHLTTAGGVKLRALQDGSGAVTTEQLGWLPGVVQQTAATSQIPKLDSNSVIAFTDFYDCSNYAALCPSGINIYGALRRHSGIKASTESPSNRLQIQDGGGSIRRIKFDCDQLNGAPSACRIKTDRFIIDDVQMEHKANAGILIQAKDKCQINNTEFWDSHWQLYMQGGKKTRIYDSYFTATWIEDYFGEGVKSIQDPSGGTDFLKISGCYFDRLKRDGVDLTGAGTGIRIVGNIFHLNGTGRVEASNALAKQGIDIKLPPDSATRTDHMVISDNIFWGAAYLTTQVSRDNDTAENRWTTGIIGISSTRNTFERKSLFSVKGNCPLIEPMTISANDRVIGALGAKLTPEAGSMRNAIWTAGNATDGTVNISPTGMCWIDFSNYITLYVGSNNLIDWNSNFIGPVITGHVTKFNEQAAWWTRSSKDNYYMQLRVSVTTYGAGDILRAWSDGNADPLTPGEGFMVSSCFGKSIDSLLEHTIGNIGKINDCYVLGNIVKATNLVNDPGTDIRTGLWIRQNTSDGANARTGAGTTSPVIEQNVGVS